LRARGWRATFAIVLLAVGLAADAIVFPVADSIGFRRIPYSIGDRNQSREQAIVKELRAVTRS